MKKYLFISILFAACSFAGELSAQNVIVENFDDKIHFDWQEFSDKSGSALIKNGALELTCNEEEKVKTVQCELPLRIEGDFKISATIQCPVINDKNFFGILFDKDENLNKCLFLLKEAQFKCCIYNDNKPIEFSDTRPIKLNGGKNLTVNIVLERKGGKYVFSMNNMEIYKWSRDIKSTDFGFYTENKSSIRIEEIRVEQEFYE